MGGLVVERGAHREPGVRRADDGPRAAPARQHRGRADRPRAARDGQHAHQELLGVARAGP